MLKFGLVTKPWFLHCGDVEHSYIFVKFYDYFNLIEVAVVIFILVLSFRTDRFVRRTTNEENNTIELRQKISTFVANKEIKKKALDTLLQISAYKTLKGLQNSYNELKNSLATAKPQIKDKKIFSEILGKIDMLVHSKQQGINFGELTALFILTFITTGGILFLFPSGVEGWAGFFVEMFAFLMASTVLFLFFNILDLQKDRNHPILKNIPSQNNQNDNFSIIFRDTQNRNFERWVSIIICISITLAYAWLLWSGSNGIATVIILMQLF